MRTTITIEDRVLEKLKKRAAASGSSVSQLLEQAARRLLQDGPTSERRQKFRLVTYGRGGHFSERNIDKTSMLLEAEDLEQFTPQR